MTNKILVVCYIFPPSVKIGGKRWFNLGKELHTLCTVDILTFAENTKNSGDFNQIYTIKSSYPKILDKKPSSIFERISYKLQHYKRKLLVKGTIYDKTSLDGKKVRNRIIGLQEKNHYDSIICTGAPFSLLYYVVLLKKNQLFSTTQFLSDIRDPWTWGQGYGIANLNSKRKAVEQTRERTVVTESNIVSVPAQTMAEHIHSIYPNSNTIIIPHGFDKKKIDRVLNNSEKQSKNSEIKLIYGGTWYRDINESFLKLLRSLEQIENYKYNYRIYTEFPERVSDFNLSATTNILFKKSEYIPEKQLFKEINNSHIYVVIFPEHARNFISAKFFEIFYIGTPILVISKKGILSDFIQKNSFGFHLEPENVNKITIKKIVDTVVNEPITKAISNDLLKYDFSNIAKQILKEFNS